ncbi:MAG: hypothetical protein EOO51_12715 [Flavobacterium sp.]|nr:MAG: hypothetical protein EOO51_12715 [Flavobacterium sp.]
MPLIAFTKKLPTVFSEGGYHKVMLASLERLPHLVRTIVDQRVNSGFCTASFLACPVNSHADALDKIAGPGSGKLPVLFIENEAYKVLLPSGSLLPFLIQSVSTPDPFVTVSVYFQCNVTGTEAEAISNYQIPE